MDRDSLWQHTHAERLALAATLAGLTRDQWATPSLCAGWTVKHVAAHVIATPQMGPAEVAGLFLRNLGRGYNTVIDRDVQRRSRQPVSQVLKDYDRWAASRSKVVVTTTVEPLVDVLVHHQDIVRPLGLMHDTPVDAALVAIDRVRSLAFLMGTRRLVRSVRMVATDACWEAGRGPVVEGRIQELLLLSAGRGHAAAGLTGPGVQTLDLRPDRRTSR